MLLNESISNQIELDCESGFGVGLWFPLKRDKQKNMRLLHEKMLVAFMLFFFAWIESGGVHSQTAGDVVSQTHVYQNIKLGCKKFAFVGSRSKLCACWMRNYISFPLR